MRRSRVQFPEAAPSLTSCFCIGIIRVLEYQRIQCGGKFGTTDCTTSKCGVFVRYDHTASADFSEDQFLPITFANPVQSVVFDKTAVRLVSY